MGDEIKGRRRKKKEEQRRRRRRRNKTITTGNWKQSRTRIFK